MEDYRPTDLAAWIQMERTVRRDLSLLLVEGIDDERFWHRRHDARASILRSMGGKMGVLAWIEQSERDGIPGVVGVIDADWDRLEVQPSSSPHICRTDAHDLEATLIFTEALESVLTEYGDREKLRSFYLKEGDLRRALLARGLPFGKLRWICRQRGASQDWIQANVHMDRESWEIRWDALLSVAVRQGVDSDPQRLKAMLQPSDGDDAKQLCQGKDLAQILTVGLWNLLGNRQVNVAYVTSLLRQSLQHPELQKLDLYRDILAWQTRNPPYRVLPR